MKKNKGFTLIELLVVIAIIGILSSVVLASLNSARVKGRDAKRVSDLSQIKLALELYFDSNRNYPAATSSLVDGGFIATWPQAPLAGESYEYAASGTPATTYVLAATLEDGNHVTLSGDLDDANDGGSSIVCDDPKYCVAP